MILFLVTALVLLGLLVIIPFWAGTGLDGVPVIAVTALAVGVVISAVIGRSPKD